MATPGVVERKVPAESCPPTFGLALAGVLYYAYLTYVEVAVLRAICIWCVLSALITVAIFGLAVVRTRALVQELQSG